MNRLVGPQYLVEPQYIEGRALRKVNISCHNRNYVGAEWKLICVPAIITMLPGRSVEVDRHLLILGS